MRPLLVLSVQGVVSPIGEHPPDHYRMVNLIDHQMWGSERTGRRLRGLTRAFDTVWCSPCGDVNLLGAVLGIPELESLAVDELGEAGPDECLEAVIGRAENRACAWLATGHSPQVRAWAAARRFPTRLVRTDAEIGLTEREMEQLLGFLRELDRLEAQGAYGV